MNELQKCVAKEEDFEIKDGLRVLDLTLYLKNS